MGMLVFSTAMTFAGTFAVPRRHWDITFTNAPFDMQFHPAVDLERSRTPLRRILG